MSVLRRVLPWACCALTLLFAVGVLGQTAKKKKKTTPHATTQAQPCGVDGDGNPVPPANCTTQALAPQPVTAPQPAPAPQPTPAPQPQPAPVSPASIAPAANDPVTPVCTSLVPANDSIEMTAAGGEATYSLTNPIGVKAKDIKARWLPEQLLMQPNASAPATLLAAPFTVGFCGKDPKDNTKPLNQTFPLGGDLQALSPDAEPAPPIVIRFVPAQAGSITQYLELKWTDSSSKPQTKMYKVTGNAGIPDYAKDSRYKLWAYTGYTYLRSKNDFKDGFAELLMRFEKRWRDDRIAMKQYHKELYDEAVATGRRCDRSKEIKKLQDELMQQLIVTQENPTDANVKALNAAKEKVANAISLARATNACPAAVFTVARVYGEAGLTGTTVVTTGNPMDPNQTTIGGTTQAFAGGFGLGFGRTVLVSTVRPTDTSAFSTLGVFRLAAITVPAATDDQGKLLMDANGHPLGAFTAFNYSLNVRVENEPSLDDKVTAGSFEGAYAEFGFGESEQFSRKKYPRLRFDGLIPIPGGSDLFRFALRLQVDAARPFARKKNDFPDNLSSEIRISALFNMDLLQLGKRLSGK